MLCLEGIGQALKCYLDGGAPEGGIPVARPAQRKIYVSGETKEVRPFIVGCILRNIDLSDDSTYGSFMQLQEKLHHNIGKKRALVAIGTHDLDKMEDGDIHYKALAPEEIKFTALNMKEERNAGELLEIYKTHKKLKHFLHLVEGKAKLPVIYDAKGVLSLPPLINSERTKISHDTKNVFIECTATDHTKVNIVLHTLVNMYSRHCTPAFEYEEVQVIYSP